ncbi:MAG: TetR/AcrR family transcriptional regulator [Bacteroidia bacterium]
MKHLKKTLALTKIDIIKKSIPVFKDKGYGATSISDIASACGLLKGSLYHHFISKDELMKEVLLYLKQYFVEKVFAIAYNKEWTVEKRLDRLARKSEEQFLEGPGGCFMAMIGTETVVSNPKFKEIIIGFFIDWKLAFVHLYSQVCDEKIAADQADRAIMTIEGAVLMMRIHNNADYLTHVQENLVKEFEELKNKQLVI